MKNLLFVSVLIFCTNHCQLFAGQNGTGKKSYHAMAITSDRPVIDGKLNDTVWQEGNWEGNFIQREPEEGVAPRQNTEFKLFFDDSHLYLAFRMHDTEADKIEKIGSRRDGEEGDFIKVGFDSFNDQRTAFLFTLTATGVKGDAVMSDDGNTEDDSWNPVWHGEVSQDNNGWYAEMKIPFNQLRFAKSANNVWGLQVQRKIYRYGENDFWQFFAQDAVGVVSRFGELRGVIPPARTRRIEVLPYFKGDLATTLKESGNPFNDGSELSGVGGLDAKVGLTSDMTIDLTVNPDFGQIEADPSELNLTAFETFFQEQRPFFVEGKNILNYHVNSGSFRSSENIFYSRRIGQTPSYSPGLASGAYSDNPTKTNIAAAAKLTGKTQNGISIGVMEAVTTKETAKIMESGVEREETAEPLTNYFAGRIQKDFRNGDTRFGSMLTAVNRDIGDAHLNFLNESAYTGGIDIEHSWQNKTYFANLMTVFSRINGDEAAIQRAQKSSSRYYNRPDAAHLTYDPTATSMSGHGGTASIGKQGNGHFQYSILTTWRSPGLELNDIGFQRDADYTANTLAFAYYEYTPKWFYRNYNIRFKRHDIWDFDGTQIARGGDLTKGGDVHGDLQLKNYWGGRFGYHRWAEGLSKNKLRGGPMFLESAVWHRHITVNSDTRKNLQGELTVIEDKADDGIFTAYEYRFDLNYRPSSALSFSMSANYKTVEDDLQYVATVPVIEQDAAVDTRYIFGEIDSKTLGIVLRANYSITPNMTIEYYGQPFVSAGKYSNYKKITNPRAANFNDRFHTFDENDMADTIIQDDSRVYIKDQDGTYDFPKRDFNFSEFQSNFVFRWEYSPGSTLFLVWTQARNYERGVSRFSDNKGVGSFSYGNNIDDLFTSHPDNVFLVKFNHWFSF